jgi:dTDP-4-dehydrorhamnose reductase
MPTEFLITGAGGLLARALRDSLERRGITPVMLARKDCDVTNADAVAAMFDKYETRVILNCAAYTKVDQAEKDPAAADAVNADAVALLAAAAKRHGAFVVHYSTDFVFNGKSDRPYRPDDPTDPLSAYGRSKLLGEKMLQARGSANGWLILRTAWLYGLGGPCFPRTIADRGKAGQPLRVVNDQIGSPTYVADLAEATLKLLDHKSTGIWHLVNAGAASWFDFAAAILKAFDLTTNLSSVTTAEWTAMRPGQAIRPANSVLDISEYETVIGPMRRWQDALADYARRARSGD